ncbi:MAG TPA: hypothetical protein VFH51_20875, partial [Myxococcota bacterium]|nr:hypothetical protein [Myxococcota bacterium]
LSQAVAAGARYQGTWFREADPKVARTPEAVREARRLPADGVPAMSLSPSAIPLKTPAPSSMVSFAWRPPFRARAHCSTLPAM